MMNTNTQTLFRSSSEDISARFLSYMAKSLEFDNVESTRMVFHEIMNFMRNPVISQNLFFSADLSPALDYDGINALVEKHSAFVMPSKEFFNGIIKDNGCSRTTLYIKEREVIIDHLINSFYDRKIGETYSDKNPCENFLQNAEIASHLIKVFGRYNNISEERLGYVFQQILQSCNFISLVNIGDPMTQLHPQLVIYLYDDFELSIKVVNNDSYHFTDNVIFYISIPIVVNVENAKMTEMITDDVLVKFELIEHLIRTEYGVVEYDNNQGFFKLLGLLYFINGCAVTWSSSEAYEKAIKEPVDEIVYPIVDDEMISLKQFYSFGFEIERGYGIEQDHGILHDFPSWEYAGFPKYDLDL